MFPEANQNQSPFGYKPMDQAQMYGPFTDALTRQPAQQTPAQPSGYGGKKEALAMFASKFLEGASNARRQAFEKSEQHKMEQARNLNQTLEHIQNGPYTQEAKQKAMDVWTQATAGGIDQELSGGQQGQGGKKGGGKSGQQQEHPALALARHFIGGMLGPTENRQHVDYGDALHSLASIVHDPTSRLDPSKFTQAGLELIAGTSGQQGSPGQMGFAPQTVTMPSPIPPTNIELPQTASYVGPSGSVHQQQVMGPGVGVLPLPGQEVTAQSPTVTGQTPSAPVNSNDVYANLAWQKNAVAAQKQGINIMADPLISARMAPLDPETQQRLALVSAQVADIQAQRENRTKPTPVTFEMPDGKYVSGYLAADGITRLDASGNPIPKDDPRRTMEKGELVGQERNAAREREIAERAHFQQELEVTRQHNRQTIQRVTQLGLNLRTGANNAIKADMDLLGQFDKLLEERGQVADKITRNPPDRARLEQDLAIKDQQIQRLRPTADAAVDRLDAAADSADTKKPPVKAAGTPKPATGGGGSIRDRLDRAFGGAPAPVAQGSATAPTHRYTGGDQISPVQ